MEKKEILTDDILEKCKEFHNEALEEVVSRLDMNVTNDLPFAITERVYWWFVDEGNEYEEPCIEDIGNVVECDYLNRK